MIASSLPTAPLRAEHHDERLTLAEAAELFTAMERAAARIKAAA